MVISLGIILSQSPAGGNVLSLQCTRRMKVTLTDPLDWSKNPLAFFEEPDRILRWANKFPIFVEMAQIYSFPSNTFALAQTKVFIKKESV